MFDLKSINYLSDPVAEYTLDLKMAITLSDLKKVMEQWKTLANHANEIVQKMNEEDFEKFRAGMRIENQGKFAGEEWFNKYAEVVMPQVMFVVSSFSHDRKAPWGLVYIRMLEYGAIKEDGGIAYLVEQK
jgi:hypothetical protein